MNRLVGSVGWLTGYWLAPNAPFIPTPANIVAPRVAGGAEPWVVGVTMISVGAGCCWCTEALLGCCNRTDCPSAVAVSRAVGGVGVGPGVACVAMSSIAAGCSWCKEESCASCTCAGCLLVGTVCWAVGIVGADP